MPQNQPKVPLFVAIHGIGDQYRYATIQGVSRQFTRYCGAPISWSLGSFHLSPKMSVAREYVIDSSAVPKGRTVDFERAWFGEIFWADLHREAAKKEDTLEEEKAWARTAVNRLRNIDRRGHAESGINYEKTAAVLDEVVETIGTIENLTYLASKAGWFNFSLKTVMDDFIGAVQVVADFKDYREEIINRFCDTMQGLHDSAQPTEIHLVAHSEGTVVTLRALMEKLKAGGAPEWAAKVSTIMTIGAPLNKHIVMWPSLWTTGGTSLDPELTPNEDNLREDKKKILWYNYYDKGDPIGYDLDITRKWLERNGWIANDGTGKSVFKFSEDNENGFVRCALPGEAHNAYWEDDELFDHYFGHLVIACEPKVKPLGNKFWPQLFSYIIPYGVCLALLAFAVYVLVKPVHAYMRVDERCCDLAWNVLGYSGIIAGITAGSRIPRLTKRWPWKLAAIALCAGGICCGGLLTKTSRICLEGAFSPVPWQVVAALVAAVSSVLAALRPYARMRPLAIMGLVAAGMVAFHGIMSRKPDVNLLAEKAGRPQLWPVVVGLLAFYFLWYLAGSLFDLSFIWYEYVRGVAARREMAQISLAESRRRDRLTQRYKQSGITS